MARTASRHRGDRLEGRDLDMVEKLERITQIVSAGDEAHVRQAIESVHWEWRGLLQRLVRTGEVAAPSVPTA
jgi:hypothetical protein